MTGDELRAMPNWAWSEMGNAEQAELAAALDDRDRLEWIAANVNTNAAGGMVPFLGSVVLQAFLHAPPMGVEHPTLRAAIDSARGKS